MATPNVPNPRGALAMLIAAGLFVGSAAHAAPAQKRSTSADRKEVDITVYNSNLGLVREVRDVDLGTGQVSLDFRGVASHIQPATVHIKSLTSPGALDVLEQNYRYDLLSPQKLLQKYVGKKVRIYRWDDKRGRDIVYNAELLSVVNGQPVVRVNGEVTYNFPGRFAFPKVPDNLIAKPTLVWKLQSRKPRQRVEATYLTGGMSWHADYVLVIGKNDRRGDLTGWVTLANNSGASYSNAHLKLVAGDVNRVRTAGGYGRLSAPMGGAVAQNSFHEEGFFEYHLYTLQHPTDVLDNEQKQVTLLSAAGIHVDKKLIFYGRQYWYRGRYGQVMKNQKVGVYLDINNSKQNHMGMPLPKGTVRVYKADSSGQKQFIGEDSIDHTPKDEKLRIKMGEAFDVVGERKQMDWKTLGTCASESTWQIELRNHKNSPVTVEDFEPIGGQWTIVSSNHPAKKEDAHTFTFNVKVPANGKTKISYRVRVRWC